MATFYEARKAKEKIANELLKRKDVFGIGVGYYDPNNKKKGAGLIVYSDKAEASIISTANIVSINAKGKKKSVPVRVVKNDSFKANALTTSNRYTGRIRPVWAGYSVGPKNKSGSAGVMVTDAKKKRLYLFSNSHVLNTNNTFDYVPTLQPGGADNGQISDDQFGKLYKFTKLQKKTNYIDAAISIPYYNSLLTPRYSRVGVVPGHYANYRVGWKLIKVGRSTGLVGGVVDSVNADVKVDYGSYGDLGEIVFKDQTIITSKQPISLAGDSGSVWLHSRNHYATAVNFAGANNGKLSVSFPIHWAFQAFGLRIAKPGYRTGRVLRVEKYNSAYTHPLTSQQLKQIQII